VDGLTRITGQKPVLNKARKSISSFKIREGNTIGASVTVRRDRMYDLFQKLIAVTLPRVRDFQGLNEKSVDQNGNLTVGIREHLAFPEISAEEVDNLFGLEITFVTTASNREEGLKLFRLAGVPFKKKQ
jgi:large subunit ribosomal protein L5